MLNYHQVYRVALADTGETDFLLATGAANLEGDQWVFWREADPYNIGTQPVATMFLSEFKELPDGIVEALERSAPNTYIPRRFIPLTRDYVLANAAAYGLKDAKAIVAVTSNDANFYLYFKGLMPEYYDEMYDDSESD